MSCQQELFASHAIRQKRKTTRNVGVLKHVGVEDLDGLYLQVLSTLLQ